MEFQLSYLKSWKMILWKCCTQYASEFGKLSSGHRTGKEMMEFQLSYLKSWKMILWKCCTRYASEFGKLSSGHRTGKVLLKPGLENFEHSFASAWDECNCVVIWTFFGLPFFGIGMKTDLFQSCGHCWVFQIRWHIECSTFTASSFRICNRSTEIPSPPLALLIVMLLYFIWYSSSQAK